MEFDLIEYGVQTYPPGLEGWRMFRMEYGGHAEDCIFEGVIWLPPWVNPYEWEADMQRTMRSTLPQEDQD